MFGGKKIWEVRGRGGGKVRYGEGREEEGENKKR